MCTEFFIISKENNVISARNLDFSLPASEQINRVNDGSTKYNYMTLYAFNDKRYIIDGMNSEGILVSTLWQSDTVYSKKGEGLYIFDIAKIALGECKNVDEVRQKVEGKKVWADEIETLDPLTNKMFKVVPPLHYSIHDKNGNSIIIEVVEGVAKVSINKYQVMTNDPFYHWHTRNIENYLHLDAGLVPKELYKECQPIFGGKLVGLPGDLTSMSRFVKTQKLVSFIENRKFSDAEVLVFVDRIIGNVTVPKYAKECSYLEPEKGLNQKLYDITFYTVIKDQKNKKFYVKDIYSHSYNRVYSLDE
jgi:choloylglycine hydrolase